MSSRSRSSSLSVTSTATAATSAAHSSTTTILLDEQPAIKLDAHLEAAYDSKNSQDPTPKPKNESSPPPLPFLPKPNTDPNLVKWDGPDDPENPQNWSFWYKSWITIVSTTATLNVYVPPRNELPSCTNVVPHSTFASSAPSSSVPIIARHFHVGREVGDLILSLFLIGYMLGPIFWGPGSELVGRRPIFIGTLAIYTIFHIGQACANNMTTLLVTRFICGFFAVAPLTNGIGVIADIWDPVNRGIATSAFASAVFLGPVLGPIVGSL